jgi:phage shock protein PspC (stress-responsive transcriptional regulator)
VSNGNNRKDGKLNLSRIALIAGVLLLVFGIWQLVVRVLGAWLTGIWIIISTIFSIVWPLVLIAGGVALMVLARKGNLNLSTNKKLYRSTRNRKLGGVCGGIAEYLGVEPMPVRLVTIALALPLWYAIIPLYILCWLFIPRNTKNYNNWV